MKHHAQRPIYAWCPYCRCPVPVLLITVELSGVLRRRCDVMVDGDASDYVAHMWSHMQGQEVTREPAS